VPGYVLQMLDTTTGSMINLPDDVQIICNPCASIRAYHQPWVVRKTAVSSSLPAHNTHGNKCCLLLLEIALQPCCCHMWLHMLQCSLVGAPPVLCQVCAAGQQAATDTQHMLCHNAKAAAVLSQLCQPPENHTPFRITSSTRITLCCCSK
jgi:hypothetical protein